MKNSRKVWLACSATLGLPLPGVAQVVRHVDIVQGKDSISIQISGEDLARPKEVSFLHGKVITFEWEAGLIGRSATVPVEKAGVTGVWYGWFSAKPKRVRLRLAVNQEIHPVVTQNADGWVVTVGQEPPVTIPSPAQKPAKVSTKDEFTMPPLVPERKAPTEIGKSRLESEPAASTNPIPLRALADSAALNKPKPTVKVTGPLIVKVISKPVSVAEWTPAPKHPAKSLHTMENPRAVAAFKMPPIETPPAAAKTNPERIVPVKIAFSRAAAKRDNTPKERIVSLECTKADVAQVLKGLALQSGENIIIGAGVTGTVSANMKNLSIDAAFDMVCAMTSIKHAKVEGTYVFAGEGDFDKTMAGLAERWGQRSVVRVVPLMSKAGGSIKSALQKWFSPATLRVSLPGDSSAEGAGASGAAGGAAPATSPASGLGGAVGQAGLPGAGGSPASPSGQPPAPSTGGSDSTNVQCEYIVLVGSPALVDDAERLAKEVDSKILDAMVTSKQMERDNKQRDKEEAARKDEERIKSQAELELVQKTYQVQSGKASKLKAVIVSQAQITNVTLLSSPDDSMKQVIVCEGQPRSVDRVISILQQLDTGSASDELIAYEIKFADPRALRESIIAQVPGLRATLPPNNVGNTGVYVKGEEKNQSNEVAATTQQSNQQSAAGGGPAPGSTGATSNSQVSDSTFEAPFATEEAISGPMRLLLRGSPEQIEKALGYLKTLDVAPKQVALELRVMELSKQDAINAGIDWSILSGGAVKILNLNNSQATPSNTVGVGISAPNVNGDVTASLDRIATGTNLLARPNMVALDGRAAEIFIGDIIRYVQSITNSQNGVSVTTGEVPVGVRLSVLPRIGADGNLTLDLRPRISILKSFTAVPGGGELPQTSTRIAQDTVTMKSGETLAIGGLIQDQDTNTESGIPFLMNLPILGNLFKSTTKSKTRTEIVIFLTAREIDGAVHADHMLPIQNDFRLVPPVRKGGHK